MFLQKFSFQSIVLISLILCLAACTSIGTILLPKNRQGFNAAMITSDEQQLLLNIVRAMFEDRVSFMSVSSITTSNTLSASGGSNYNYSPSVSHSVSFSDLNPDGSVNEGTTRSGSRSFSLSNPLSFNANASYSDSPTISFTPLQGERFTRQMLSPLDIPTLVMMLKSGWGVGRIFRISVEWIDGLHNDSIMHSRTIPKVKPFVDFVDNLRQLIDDNVVFVELGQITEVSVD